MLAHNKPLDANQRLTKAIVSIMAHPRYVALAGVLMIGERTIGNVRTACTNGRDEIYGEKFVDSLNDPELRFLVLHENYHKLYRHLVTWKHLHDENHRLANMACDYVINQKIADDNAQDGFATMPEGGLLDPRFRGMNAAEVYKILKDEMQGNDGDDGDESDIGQPGKPGDNSQDGSGNKPQPGKGGTGGNESLDDHDWEGAAELSDQEKHDLARDIDEAIRQGALAAGKIGTGVDRDLAELLKAKVDWREVLREFVTTTCAGSDFGTWRRPNRRFMSSGHYLPSTISERVDELVIACDTSGSIGQAELSVILTEVKSICDTVRPEAIRLLYWDTEVAGDEKYVGEEVERLTKSTKPKGGGGTCVSCVSKYINTHSIKAQAVIVITDGYLGSDWGSFTMPTLWCIVGGYDVTAPYGKTVRVED